MLPYYKDDSVTIYHGDNRDIVGHLDRFDLLLTDPPYGIGEAAGKNKSRTRKTDKINYSKDYGNKEWDNNAPKLDNILRFIDQSRSAIIFGGNYFGLPAASKWLVWDKQMPGDFADCELAWTNLGGAIRRIVHTWAGWTQQAGHKEKRIHPTQKPLRVMKWCIAQAKIEPPGIIFDPYMGSGTSLVAAVDLGFNAVGIDQDEEYCEMAAAKAFCMSEPEFTALLTQEALTGLFYMANPQLKQETPIWLPDLSVHDEITMMSGRVCSGGNCD